MSEIMAGSTTRYMSNNIPVHYTFHILLKSSQPDMRITTATPHLFHLAEEGSEA